MRLARLHREAEVQHVPHRPQRIFAPGYSSAHTRHASASHSAPAGRSQSRPARRRMFSHVYDVPCAVRSAVTCPRKSAGIRICTIGKPCRSDCASAVPPLAASLARRPHRTHARGTATIVVRSSAGYRPAIKATSGCRLGLSAATALAVSLYLSCAHPRGSAPGMHVVRRELPNRPLLLHIRKPHFSPVTGSAKS